MLNTFFNVIVNLLFALQPEAPAASSLHGTPRPEEEDDGDLNKALGVQRFQQILSPAAAVPDEQHHNYHEEDIECKHMWSPCCSREFIRWHFDLLYMCHVRNSADSSPQTTVTPLTTSTDLCPNCPPRDAGRRATRKGERTKITKAAMFPAAAP